MTEILGRPAPRRLGPFTLVRVGAATTLDFVTVDDSVHPQHNAFLVTEADFDSIFDRIRERGLTYWADPTGAKRVRSTPGTAGAASTSRTSTALLEAITRPYGSGGSTTAHPHPLLSAGESTGSS